MIGEKDVTGKQSNCFTVLVKENNGWPIFEPGNVMVVDRALSPKSGDYILVFIPAKQKTAIRKFGDRNENLHNVNIIGVISELRKYF